MSGRTTLCGVNQVSTFKGIEACHPTFTDIFLVDTKLTKVGRNSRGFLELSTAVRLGWV